MILKWFLKNKWESVNIELECNTKIKKEIEQNLVSMF
jgi:hypothetical protein